MKYALKKKRKKEEEETNVSLSLFQIYVLIDLIVVC